MLTHQALIELGLSPDMQTLTERAVKAAESIGFGLIAGMRITGRLGTSAEVTSFGNPPDAFVEAAKSLEEGMRDPFLAQLLARPGHHTYTQGLYVGAGAADLWDHQAAFGYGAGMAVSLHAPAHAEVFSIGVDGRSLPSSGADLVRLRGAIQLLGLHAQAAMQRMQGPLPCSTELLKSELSALQAAAVTVYNRRGSLVAISSESGRELQSAVRKTGARNLAGALLRVVDGSSFTLANNLRKSDRIDS